MKIRLGLLTMAVGLLAAPTGATAEYLIPPGNSAATQYTEAYPTAGGQHRSGGGGGASPAEALGAGNARRLEARGADGRATAALAAETSPGADSVRSGEAEPSSQSSGGANRTGGSSHHPGSSPGDRERVTPGPASAGQASPGTEAGGDSGFGAVIGQATGTSSGELGLLLPLAILATAAWAVAFLLRTRRRPIS